MPSKYRLRRLFKKRFIVTFLAKIFNKLKFTPNCISIMTLIFAILSSIIVYLTENLVLFGVLIFIMTLLDGVDGTLARLTNNTTQFGGFLDSILDRCAEITVLTALYLSGTAYFIYNATLYTITFIFLISGSLIISFLRSRAQNSLVTNTKYDLDVGLFARSERLISIVIILVIPFNIVFSLGIITICVGIVGTAIFRFITYRKYIKAED
ncbi:MAG: hypothetical protein GF364_18260 [Candidatus Lokiarchaeota archaeon]|nr:hypothetical protein [Candidatus Lokiarchaeota archaeon]